jgi:hypothetical protein
MMKTYATETEPYEQILTSATLNPHVKSIDLCAADLLHTRASDIARQLSQVAYVYCTTISYCIMLQSCIVYPEMFVLCIGSQENISYI